MNFVFGSNTFKVESVDNEIMATAPNGESLQTKNAVRLFDWVKVINAEIDEAGKEG